MIFEEMQEALRQRLDASRRRLAPNLSTSCASRLDRAQAIGTFWGHRQPEPSGELLIDLEEDTAARAVVFGLLPEMERK